MDKYILYSVVFIILAQTTHFIIDKERHKQLVYRIEVLESK